MAYGRLLAKQQRVPGTTSRKGVLFLMTPIVFFMYRNIGFYKKIALLCYGQSFIVSTAQDDKWGTG